MERRERQRRTSQGMLLAARTCMDHRALERDDYPLDFRLLASRTRENKYVLFYAFWLGVMCYSSSRKSKQAQNSSPQSLRAI